MVLCSEVITETSASFEELVSIMAEGILADCPLVSVWEAEDEARTIVSAAIS